MAPEIELGAFELSAIFVGQITRETVVEVDSSIAARASSVLGRKVVVASGRLYAGDSPGSPELGDLRIRYSMVEPAAVSVVGAQRGGALKGYEAETGGRIALLKYGQVAAAEMFEAAQGGEPGLDLGGSARRLSAPVHRVWPDPAPEPRFSPMSCRSPVGWWERALVSSPFFSPFWSASWSSLSAGSSTGRCSR